MLALSPPVDTLLFPQNNKATIIQIKNTSNLLVKFRISFKNSLFKTKKTHRRFLSYVTSYDCQYGHHALKVCLNDVENERNQSSVQSA